MVLPGAGALRAGRNVRQNKVRTIRTGTRKACNRYVAGNYQAVSSVDPASGTLGLIRPRVTKLGVHVTSACLRCRRP